MLFHPDTLGGMNALAFQFHYNSETPFGVILLIEVLRKKLQFSQLVNTATTISTALKHILI